MILLSEFVIIHCCFLWQKQFLLSCCISKFHNGLFRKYSMPTLKCVKSCLSFLMILNAVIFGISLLKPMCWKNNFQSYNVKMKVLLKMVGHEHSDLMNWLSYYHRNKAVITEVHSFGKGCLAPFLRLYASEWCIQKSLAKFRYKASWPWNSHLLNKMR